MKENKEILSNKINEIGQIAVECLNGRKFSKVIIGLIIVNTNNNEVQNLKVFYKNLENKLIYFNELIYRDDFNDSIEEQKYLQLQDLLYDLKNYCVSCGDEWKYMTLSISNDGNFSIDFKYDPIEVIEWRKINGLLN